MGRSDNPDHYKVSGSTIKSRSETRRSRERLSRETTRLRQEASSKARPPGWKQEEHGAEEEHGSEEISAREIDAPEIDATRIEGGDSKRGAWEMDAETLGLRGFGGEEELFEEGQGQARHPRSSGLRGLGGDEGHLSARREGDGLAPGQDGLHRKERTPARRAHAPRSGEAEPLSARVAGERPTKEERADASSGEGPQAEVFPFRQVGSRAPPHRPSLTERGRTLWREARETGEKSLALAKEFVHAPLTLFRLMQRLRREEKS